MSIATLQNIMREENNDKGENMKITGGRGFVKKN